MGESTKIYQIDDVLVEDQITRVDFRLELNLTDGSSVHADFVIGVPL